MKQVELETGQTQVTKINWCKQIELDLSYYKLDVCWKQTRYNPSPSVNPMLETD